MSSRTCDKVGGCNLTAQSSKRHFHPRNPVKTQSHFNHLNLIQSKAFKITASALLLLGLAFVASSEVKAQRVGSSIAWGNYETSGSGNSHFDAAQIALLADRGRHAALPGTTVYAIGVMNSINVIGDDNLLNSNQEGDNSGDVSSQLIFNQ